MSFHPQRISSQQSNPTLNQPPNPPSNQPSNNNSSQPSINNSNQPQINASNKQTLPVRDFHPNPTIKPASFTTKNQQSSQNSYEPSFQQQQPQQLQTPQPQQQQQQPQQPPQQKQLQLQQQQPRSFNPQPQQEKKPEKKNKQFIQFKFQCEWRFWLVLVTNNQRNARQYQIEEIFGFDTVEFFYKYFHALPKISTLRNVNGKRISLSLFRNKIKPAWEDPENQTGSDYSFSIDTKIIEQKPELINKIWKSVILRLIGNTFDVLPPDNEINGVVMTLKKDSPKIYELQFWLKAKQAEKRSCSEFIEDVIKFVNERSGETSIIKFTKYNSRQAK
ncbi:hypothetical protein TRFO_14119 [Tritrichomonas foetus]|uniref:Uncharacterized protein n=1 Tax=Tritrichomonas foetus TaxID=1144522 RepID=A0A1J4KW53_9EUKA|nr:hypothetical protein TRFO_14119 [Tritrichomonas foetus]|eukprot:OHT15370.1 hypothetical protein TRFO_14119 [Tritrichomonas foetus]